MASLLFQCANFRKMLYESFFSIFMRVVTLCYNRKTILQNDFIHGSTEDGRWNIDED